MVRKVTRAKWSAPDFSSGEIPADVVSIDLRTEANSLSLWECGSASTEELESVVLALAAAPGRDSISKIELVWMDANALDDAGVELKRTQGRTAMGPMVNKHFDAIHLDYTRLGQVAQAIASGLKECRHRIWTLSGVRKLLTDAVFRKAVSLESLAQKIQDEVRKELNKRQAASDP